MYIVRKSIKGSYTALVLVAGLLFFVSQAAAVPVVLNDIQTQTVDGQDFTFDFNSLLPSDGTGGTFVLHVQGDFDGGPSETLDWNIDGLISAGPVGGFVDGLNGQGGPFDFSTVFQDKGNIEFQVTYLIPPAILDSILSDTMASIFVDLADDVGLFQPPNFVEVTLSYNSTAVPEPGTMALLGFGLVGAGAIRKKRSRA